MDSGPKNTRIPSSAGPTPDILRKLLDAAPVPMAYVDRDGHCCFANRCHAETLGVTREELQGRPLAQAWSADLWEHARPHVEAALQGEERRFATRLAAGTGHWLELRCVPDRDEQGQVVGLIITARALPEQSQGTGPAEPGHAAGKPHCHAVANAAGAPDATTRSIHVLLAEDDGLSRTAMVELLKYEGFQVEEAGDGDEALRQFHAHSPESPIDVVITDVRLPGRGGYELLQAIHGTRPDTAVIFASGLRQEDSGIPPDILAQPGIEYIEKPIDVALLASIVRSLVRR